MSNSFYEQLATWSQIVASILFIVVLAYMWIRFITPAVVASQARKNAELAEIEQRRDAAKADVDVARADIADAEADARAITARADTEAARVRDKILFDAKTEGERLQRYAAGDLERARAAAREQLRSDLIEKAMQIARDAASRLDDSTNRRLVVEAVETAEKSEPA